MPVHGSWARGTPASRSAHEARRYVFVRPRETTVPSRICAEIINPARALRSTERGRHRRHLEQVRRAGVRSVGGRSDWHSRLGIRGARWNEPTSDGRACVFATRCSETSDLERVGMAKRARLPGYEGATRHRSSSVDVSFFRSGVCGGFEVGEHFGPCADDERGEQTDRASCREVASRRDDVTRRHGAPRAHRPAKMEPRACAPSQSDCRDLPSVASSDTYGPSLT